MSNKSNKSSRREIKGNPEHLSKVFERLSSTHMKNYLDFYKIHNAWFEITGKVSKRSKPISLQRGKLNIIADSPSVAQEINMMSGRIISKALSLGIRIDSLCVCIGNFKDKAKTPKRDNNLQLKPFTEGDILEEVEKVKDMFNDYGLPDDVANSLRRLYVVYNKRFNLKG